MFVPSGSPLSLYFFGKLKPGEWFSCINKTGELEVEKILNTFGSSLIVRQGTLRPVDQVTGPGPPAKVARMEKGRLFPFLQGRGVRSLAWQSARQV